MRRTPLPALAALVCAFIATAPVSALACGGFFCSAVNLVPVEQNAERILFELHSEGKTAGTVTATVEISYTGSPEDFSWVVPVPDLVGPMGVAPAETLLLLDDATAPIIRPPPTTCSTPDPWVPFGGMASDAGLRMAMDEGGVEVIDLPRVGPYEPELVSSEDPAALITWLGDNDYLITPEMEPYIADYVADGMKFLAMKLAPDASTSDIAPVKFTYPGDEPMVPISLTAVSAEPEMGVLAFVAADDRFESVNYDNLVLDTERVRADPRNGMSNYYPLISWEIDQRGGQAAVTEYANFSSSLGALIDNTWSWNDTYSEALAELGAVLDRQNFVTRMYLRLSGWEMTRDPSFTATGGGLVSNLHDLSGQPAVEVCGPTGDASVPCGDVYCGVGAQCATTDDWGDGCVCPAGTLARLISSPRVMGQTVDSTVFCQEQSFDLMASVADMDLAGAGTDPCSTTACGEFGRCIALNGFPTCDCDEGYAAAVSFGFQEELVCAEVEQAFDPDQLLWPAPAGCSCSAGRVADEPSGALALLASLLLPILLLRRRQGLAERG